MAHLHSFTTPIIFLLSTDINSNNFIWKTYDWPPEKNKQGNIRSMPVQGVFFLKDYFFSVYWSVQTFLKPNTFLIHNTSEFHFSLSRNISVSKCLTEVHYQRKKSSLFFSLSKRGGEELQDSLSYFSWSQARLELKEGKKKLSTLWRTI